MTAPRLQLVSGGNSDRRSAPLWDVPVPFAGPTAPPPFPVDVYAPWMADMVAGVAEFTQTDPCMAGVVALAVLSACAGGRIEVEAMPGWREPINIYGAVIAEPGERKSPVHGAMTDPLVDAQDALAERVRPMVAEHAALKDIADRQAEQAKAVAAKAGGDNREAAAADAVAAALAAEAIRVPTLPRLITDDATPEKLAAMMAENGGRMAIISDEGGIFDTLAGRYSGTPNLDPYLKGHAGRPMGNDRQTREGVNVRKPALTVGVMAQPSVLRRFGGNADLTGRGLLARFLFALPKSLAGYRNVEHVVPVPANVAHAYGEHVQHLAVMFTEQDGCAVVTLDDDAHRVRVAAAGDIERQLRPGGGLANMRGWADKLGGTTLRLAGLLHVARHPADPAAAQIDGATMADAVRLAAFFVAHYRAALHIIAGDQAGDTARHILGVLIAKDMQTFTRRELHRRVHRQLPKAAQVTAVLETLSQLGWLRPTEAGYELHPHAAHYAEAGDTATSDPDDDIGAAHDADEPVTGPG
jgi:replicative DNA helicase